MNPYASVFAALGAGMAFRFRRSFKVAPGVRVNVGKKGPSVSVGPPGASIKVGPTGSQARGVPSGGSSGKLEVLLGLQDDGKLEILDRNENPLPRNVVTQIKKENAEFLRSWIARKCEDWNQGIEEILNIHLDTPAPDPPREYEWQPFVRPPPLPPTGRKITLLDKLWPGRAERIRLENEERRARYREEIEEWKSAARDHKAEQVANAALFARAQIRHGDATASLLQETLEEVDWPRETLFNFEIEDDGRTLWLDVDLPEIEDLPDQSARPAKRGYRVLVKDKSAKQLREEYMTHVHAIGFRVLGETFHLLPKVETIYLSAYSQRVDKSTGHVGDEYLYSAKVDRSEWEGLNHSNVEAIDLPDCFEQFELRRKMTKTGIFKPIEPFQPEEAA